MSKAKKMNLNNLKSLENKVFTYKEILLDVYGETFKVLIDENFKSTKIESMIRDMVFYSDQSKELELEINSIVLSNMTLMKNFTDITFTGDIIKDIKLFNTMIDLGIVEKVFSYFNQEQLNKIIESVNKINANMPKLFESMKEAYNKQIGYINGESNATI